MKSFDLITSPVFDVVKASDKFENPTKRVNEMWQTDFTYFKIIGWGWYYLGTVLDDYSRYIIAWDLCTTMAATDAKATVDKALLMTGLDRTNAPKLLSDNGPCYIAKDLKEYFDEIGIKHIHGAPMHPQTQGKIERYHRSMKNVVKLENYYTPDHLRKALTEFVRYYNNQRYHESLKNVTPSDVFFGRHERILQQREQTKRRTIEARRKSYFETKSLLKAVSSN